MTKRHLALDPAQIGANKDQFIPNKTRVFTSNDTIYSRKSNSFSKITQAKTRGIGFPGE